MAESWTRFFGPDAAPASATTVYTVPAVSKAVLRHLHLSNPTASPIAFTMSVGADAPSTRVFDAFDVPANDVYDWYPVLPLEAGEIVQCSAGDTDLTIEGSGVLVTL